MPDPEPSSQSPVDLPAAGAMASLSQACLLDLLIEQAPALVRQRSLLPAFDWTLATGPQVERLQRRLAEAQLKMPAWLTTALLVAGHTLAADAVLHLTPDVQLLAAVNALEPGAAVPEPLRQAINNLSATVSMELATLSALVLRLKKLQHPALACRLALSHWDQVPTAVRHVRQELDATLREMPALRIRIAGFSTTHMLGKALSLAFAATGSRAEISEAGFGEVLSELLRPHNSYDALVLLLDAESVFTSDWRKSAEQQRESVEQKLTTFAEAVRALAQKSAMPVLINTLPAKSAPTVGYADRFHVLGGAALVELFNRRLAEVAAVTPSILLVDADQALAAIAPDRRSDPKMWYFGRIAYSEVATCALAQGFARAWQARQRGPAKVLAIDFDNTLWGGVYGDDGVDQLACGDDFPGNAFKAMQQECLRLKAQGMLVVALSKNNPDAIDVFARHQGMALTADDFAAIAINWQPKPNNIVRLAAELNLGLDSFIFLDDSPHEREAMRRMCPSVIVPEMPTDPAQRPLWLRQLGCTWPVRLTEEDSRRSAFYVAERKARALRETVASYDDYLKGLEQRLRVDTLSQMTLSRAAQLHQRTNQFNLTARRFTEADFTAFLNDPANSVVLLGQVGDKFGDHGLTIAATATIAGTMARIESFVMSCRVVGRQIEDAFLGALIDHLVARGIKRIEATYVPTAKNSMVREFYPSHSFQAAEGRGEGSSWVWLRDAGTAPRSQFVAVSWGNT